MKSVLVLEFIAMRPHRLRQNHRIVILSSSSSAKCKHFLSRLFQRHRVGSEPMQRAHCVLHCMLWFLPLVLIVTIFPINEWQKTEVASLSVSAISPLPVTQNEFKHPRSIVFHIKSYFSNIITSTQNEKRNFLWPLKFINWEASCVLHLSDTLDLRGIRPRIWWHKTSWFYNRAKTSPPKETIRHCAAKQGLRTKLSPPSRKYNRRDTCSFDCRLCCLYSVISTTDGDYVYHVNYLFSDSNDKRVKQLAARRLHEQMTQSDRKSRQTF